MRMVATTLLGLVALSLSLEARVAAYQLLPRNEAKVTRDTPNLMSHTPLVNEGGREAL